MADTDLQQDDENSPEDDVLQIEDEDEDVIDTPDGGAYVKIGDEKPTRESNRGFFENLADTDDPDILTQLDSIILNLTEKIEDDIEAREDRDKQQEEGVKRTGFDDEKVGGASFTGASRVVHPMIGKACIEFASKVMKELCPPDGPVKDKIIGDVTPKKVARAERKTNHMNWQLTEQIEEFIPTLEQVMSQVPLGGAQYTYMYYDERLERPSTEAVWIDEMILPFGAKSFRSARRRTWVRNLTRDAFDEEVERGWFKESRGAMIPTGQEPERTETQKRQDQVEGQQQTGTNVDDVRQVYQSYVWLSIDFDDQRPEGRTYAPYIVAIDKETGDCLALYRNWDPVVAKKRSVILEVHHFVEWPLLPWRGAAPLSLYHLIGGLSTSATGALRALLDAGHIANSQTLLKLKGLAQGAGGQNITINQTGITEVQGSTMLDDIRKLAMPLPFSPPSPVLFELLGFLSEQGAGMIRTSLDEEPDMSPNAPVGTTMARVEQGMVVFSSIHARMHRAMKQQLSILHRINRDYLTSEAIREDTGQVLALPADYQGPEDVVPVSDPNIFSEMQRYSQLNVIASRSLGNPIYNQAKVEERLLQGMKIPNPEELLTTPPTPEPEDPVSENVGMALGKPCTAFPNQDHVSHLKVHLGFAMDESLGKNLLIAPQLIPLMLQHLKEHLVLLYAKNMGDMVQAAARGEKMVDYSKDKDPKVAAALARALAVATAFVPEQRNNYDAVVKAGQALIQLLQQISPPQPQDPTVAAAMAAKAETDRRAQRDSADIQLKGKELQLKQAGMQQDNALDGAKLKLDGTVAQGKLSLEGARLQQDGKIQQAQIAMDGASHASNLQSLAEDNKREAARLTLEAAEQHANQQQAAVEAGLERQKQQLDAAAKERDVNAKMAISAQDNATAIKIAEMEIESGERIAVKDGKGLNKNP